MTAARNELEFRICTNCKNIHYKVYKPFEKTAVYYQRLLTFAIFHNKRVY